MLVHKLVTFMLVLCAVDPIRSAKILGLFSTISRSHVIVYSSLMRELAERGHEVTVVSTFSSGKVPKNYRDIHITIEEDSHFQNMLSDTLKGNSRMNMMINGAKMFKSFNDRSVKALTHPEFLKLKNETFDLFVLGWFHNDLQLGVASHFNCPSVVIANGKAQKNLRDFVGSPTGVSFMPLFLLPFKDPMNFVQRLINFGATAAEYVLTNAATYFIYEPSYIEVFPPERYPSLEEVKRNVSLVLVNNHFSEGNVLAYVPGMVEVGGMHIKSKPSPLPQKIKEWLDNATEGAIFFSLGTNMKSAQISEEKRAFILRVFSKLKQKVLWKWEDDQLPDKPDNVMIGKWLPQSDILAHPNTKLFISHCGLGSVNEAKYHGVPILGIPIFADQPTNLNQIVNDGWGVPLNYNELSEKSFSKALNEAINNQSYSNTIKQISSLYRDRPQGALDAAVFWIEYVIRHKGAKHMQSQAVYLNFFQYYSLDVLGFILVVVYLIIKIVKSMFRYIISKCVSKFKSKKE